MRYAVALLLVLPAVGCVASRTLPQRQIASDLRVSTGDSSKLDRRLRQLGFDDPSAVKRFVAELRDAARRGDLSTLANAIRYPLTLYERGTPIRKFDGPNEVLNDVSAVFSAKVIKALRSADYDLLFVRDQGAMIGEGEVWFYQYEEGLKITAVNP